MKSVLALACLAAVLPAAETPLLYDRVAERLAQRPDLADLGAPPAELAQFDWMLGRWSIEAAVAATESPQAPERGTANITRVNGGCWIQMDDTYPSGTQDLGFLTYNRVTRRWVAVGLDTTGNAVTTTSPGWEGSRMVFTAPAVEIVGEKVVLRQVFEQLGPDEFTVSNEEQTPDGAWHLLDRYRFRRMP